MKKIDRVFKQLSDLYEFNRRIKRYEMKKKEPADKQSEDKGPGRKIQKGRGVK